MVVFMLAIGCANTKTTLRQRQPQENRDCHHNLPLYEFSKSVGDKVQVTLLLPPVLKPYL
jgi:hypothetical protein